MKKFPDLRHNNGRKERLVVKTEEKGKVFAVTRAVFGNVAAMY